MKEWHQIAGRVRVAAIVLILLVAAGVMTACSAFTVDEAKDVSPPDVSAEPIEQDGLGERVDNAPAFQEETDALEARAGVERKIEAGFLENPDEYGPGGKGGGSLMGSIWIYLTAEEQAAAYGHASDETRELIDEIEARNGGASWQGE